MRTFVPFRRVLAAAGVVPGAARPAGAGVPGTGAADAGAVTGQPERLPGRLVRGEALQLSVYVRAADRAGGRPLHDEIIDRARAAGLAGATAIRGLDGFGAEGPAGRRRSEPVLIEITDDAAAVRAFLPVLDGLMSSGLVVLKPVETVHRPAGDRVRTAASGL